MSMAARRARSVAASIAACCLHAGLAAAATATPPAHAMIRVVFTLHVGVEPASYREWLADPGVPFTLDDGAGAGRWRIVAVARERKDGTFQLDATLSCGGTFARRVHVRTAGRENVAMIAAQSATCADDRREISADVRMHASRGDEAGEETTPAWQMYYKVCWDKRGDPTTITFLRSRPDGFARSADGIAQSMRSWTFGQQQEKRLGQPAARSAAGCDTIVIDVN